MKTTNFSVKTWCKIPKASWEIGIITLHRDIHKADVEDYILTPYKVLHNNLHGQINSLILISPIGCETNLDVCCSQLTIDNKLKIRIDDDGCISDRRK